MSEEMRDNVALEILQESLAGLQDEEYDPSVVHVFVVMGASVSTVLVSLMQYTDTKKLINDLVSAMSCFSPLWIFGVMVHKTILRSPVTILYSHCACNWLV